MPIPAHALLAYNTFVMNGRDAMDLQHVRYFVQIAQFGSVTKAAEANFISQPALSRILSALEDEVGVPLFIQQGKKLVLNHYGEIFLSAAIKSINLLDKANQDIISLRTATSGRIEVRMNILPPRFTELCTRFQSAYPNIELNVSHTGSNATDLGDIFFYNPPIDIGGRTSAKLIEEKFVAAVLPGHPLASATQVDLKTLAAYKLMILNPEGMKKSVYSAFFIHGLFPTVVEVSTQRASISICKSTTPSPFYPLITLLVVFRTMYSLTLFRPDAHFPSIWPGIKKISQTLYPLFCLLF